MKKIFSWKLAQFDDMYNDRYDPREDLPQGTEVMITDYFDPNIQVNSQTEGLYYYPILVLYAEVTNVTEGDPEVGLGQDIDYDLKADVEWNDSINNEPVEAMLNDQLNVKYENSFTSDNLKRMADAQGLTASIDEKVYQAIS